MVSIRWCSRQKNGLRLIPPNIKSAEGYLKLAQESLQTYERVHKSDLWASTISYYVFYYSLTAILARIGVRSEIHSCTLAFMQRFLLPPFTEEDAKLVQLAFEVRNDLQYYVNKTVDPYKIRRVQGSNKGFYLKSRNYLKRITADEINTIRHKLLSAISD